jgi:hypothetical protein
VAWALWLAVMVALGAVAPPVVATVAVMVIVVATPVPAVAVAVAVLAHRGPPSESDGLPITIGGSGGST